MGPYFIYVHKMPRNEDKPGTRQLPLRGIMWLNCTGDTRIPNTGLAVMRAPWSGTLTLYTPSNMQVFIPQVNIIIELSAWDWKVCCTAHMHEFVYWCRAIELKVFKCDHIKYFACSWSKCLFFLVGWFRFKGIVLVWFILRSVCGIMLNPTNLLFRLAICFLEEKTTTKNKKLRSQCLTYSHSLTWSQGIRHEETRSSQNERF